MNVRVFGEGLQAERTALAWRRTALAMAVAAIGAGRLAAPAIGAVAIALTGMGLLLALMVALSARRRYRLAHRSLTTRGDPVAVRASASTIAALAVGGVSTGLLALAFILGPGL